MTVNEYDRYGRLSMSDDGARKVQYEYDLKGRLSKQKVGGIVDIDFEYDRLGRLVGKYMGGAKNPIASLKYAYAP